MIDVVCKAIVARYAALAAASGIWPEGLFLQQAPQGTSGKYGVFYLIGMGQEEIMGGADDSIISIQIQFSLFTDAEDDGTEIVGMIAELDAGFHWHSLSVTGYNTLKLQRQAWMPLTRIDGIWQAVGTYELDIQKT